MNEEKYKLGSVEETQRLAAEGNRLYGINAFNAQTGAPITSQGLASEPPIELPEPTPSTLSGRIDGQATSLLEFDALEQKAEQERIDKKNELLESQSKSRSILESIGFAKKDVTQGVEEEFGLAGLKTIRKDALQKLRTAQVSELGEIERLQTANMTAAGASAAETGIRRKYGFEKLEAQLSYYMATDNITAVETTLNDRLTLELEPLYQQLDLQKGVSEQIYDQLTTSEKREWEVAISKTENSIQERKDIATYRNGIITTAMQNGVPIPSYVVQELNKAGSVEEVNQILARNGISLAKPEKATGDGVPTVKNINGVDMQWNPASGKWETITTGVTPGGTVQQAQAQANVESLTSLVSDPNIRTAVGPSRLARFVGAGLDRATGGRQNFIASVEQIRSNLNLEALIGAKARGATFGALSDQELQVLASSASKIGTWAKKDGDGNVVAYNANEKDFKKELDKINNFARLDYIRKGGLPEDIGAVLMTDGNYYVQNSDGSYTQIN